MEKAKLFLNRINYDMIRGGSQKRGDNRTNNVIGGPLSDAIMKQLGGKKGLIRNLSNFFTDLRKKGNCWITCSKSSSRASSANR